VLNRDPWHWFNGVLISLGSGVLQCSGVWIANARTATYATRTLPPRRDERYSDAIIGHRFEHSASNSSCRCRWSGQSVPHGTALDPTLQAKFGKQRQSIPNPLQTGARQDRPGDQRCPPGCPASGERCVSIARHVLRCGKSVPVTADRTRSRAHMMDTKRTHTCRRPQDSIPGALPPAQQPSGPNGPKVLFSAEVTNRKLGNDAGS
jgi:hypothetical protein